MNTEEFNDFFADFDEYELFDNNSQSSSETFQLADDSITNNLPMLDQLQPPAPVFLNNMSTQENKAIYFKDFKLLKEFVRSNKDLADQYLILLPISAIGTLRYDPRHRLYPAVLYKKDLVK